MTDTSYDVNIAKAFACQRQNQRMGKTPVLYKIVLYNVDFYDVGAAFLEHLPFQRPKFQKALSIISLNEIMQYHTGVIVSLTEHPFYYDHKGTPWDSFGGPSFKIDGKSFDSIFLGEKKYRDLQSLLCPCEPYEVKDLFYTVICKIKNNISRFHLSHSDKKRIIDRFSDLTEELGISSEKGI